MREIFKFELRPSYPHMSEADKAIWERVINKYPGAYNSVQYDFHVGDPPPFNTLMDDDSDLNQDKLYRLRIDVVGESEDFIDIIEIKPKAGPSVIGQVKGYKALFERDEEPKKPVRAIIITDMLNPNMEWLCKKEGVILIVA